MKKLIGNLLLVTGILVYWNCVGPEEPLDGLIEDMPAVVNTANAFTFNLKGNKYTFDENYTLSMQADTNSVLTTSLIVQNWTGRDTTRIFMIDEGDTTYSWFQITGNMIYTAVDSLKDGMQNIPKKILFEGINFTGTLLFTLAKD